MNRENVYKLIDSEREYQNKRWSGQSHDEKHSIGDWIIFIEYYLNEAKKNYSTLGDVEALDSIRKIAGLAVATMEYNETLKRY